MKNASGKDGEFKNFVGEGCKETEAPCAFLSIDGGGIASCSAGSIELCQKFIEWKRKMDEAWASGKKVTVQVTEKGLNYAKSSLHYWIMKKRYEQAIGEFYAMPEGERQALLEKLMAGEIDNVAKKS